MFSYAMQKKRTVNRGPAIPDLDYFHLT